MTNLKSSLFVILSLLLTTVVKEVVTQQSGSMDSDGHPWSYDESKEDGPQHWSKNYEFCDNFYQSPIDIKLSASLYRTELGHFIFSNYENAVPFQFQLKNTGKTIQVVIDGDEADISISNGNLSSKYILDQLHFHWGKDPSEGSEHLLNGESSSMEIHLVHWKEDYESFNAALNFSDGVAVLGVFVEATSDSSLSIPEIANLTEYFDDILNAGNITTIPSFALKSLLPSDKTYHRYDGSLTTPACQESVIWTVFQNPIYLTEEVISKFRTVYDSHGDQMSYNFRPVQYLNNRKVYTSLNSRGAQTALGRVLTTSLLMVVVVALVDFTSVLRR